MPDIFATAGILLAMCHCGRTGENKSSAQKISLNVNKKATGGVDETTWLPLVVPTTEGLEVVNISEVN